MSIRAERVFLPTLRELERALPVPIPERVRILRELEYDLEELRDQLEADGLSREGARQRALEILAPDAATLRELTKLHTPLYLRLTRGVRGDVLRLLERVAMAATAGTVLAIETTLLLGTDVMRAPSPFIWPVIALGTLLFAAVAAKAFELWVRRDHRAPGRGLRAIPALATVIVGTALSGAFFELYRLVSSFEAAGASSGAEVLAWLSRSSGLVAVALLLAMTGAFAWFLIAHWLALMTDAHHDLLDTRAPTRVLHHTTHHTMR